MRFKFVRRMQNNCKISSFVLIRHSIQTKINIPSVHEILLHLFAQGLITSSKITLSNPQRWSNIAMISLSKMWISMITTSKITLSKMKLNFTSSKSIKKTLSYQKICGSSLHQNYPQNNAVQASSHSPHTHTPTINS